MTPNTHLGSGEVGVGVGVGGVGIGGSLRARLGSGGGGGPWVVVGKDHPLTLSWGVEGVLGRGGSLGPSTLIGEGGVEVAMVGLMGVLVADTETPCSVEERRGCWCVLVGGVRAILSLEMG